MRVILLIQGAVKSRRYGMKSMVQQMVKLQAAIISLNEAEAAFGNKSRGLKVLRTQQHGKKINMKHYRQSVSICFLLFCYIFMFNEPKVLFAKVE